MKKVVLITVVVVALVLNMDKVVEVDNNVKIIVLLVLAGLLSVYEYKRVKRIG